MCGYNKFFCQFQCHTLPLTLVVFSTTFKLSVFSYELTEFT